MSAALSLPLIAHPATPGGAIDDLRVQVARDGAGWLLRYTLTGKLARLRIPATAARPAATDGLWRHSCFECFVGGAHGTAYREFNFSPSGDWAAYAFRAERVRDSAAATLPAPRIACTHDDRTLTLDAWLPTAALPATDIETLLGLTAVIETSDGSLSYWALHHPAPQPDFHHRAGWTARLPAFR